MPSKSVVVVDDDQASLQSLECWLIDAGYDVVSSPRFEDARAYLANHTPDILLADVRLGEFNGLQLALFVKGEHPHVVAIVFYDYEDPVLAEEAARCGARFVRRPETSAGLMECLAESA
jgi:DNA-binding NtrC family response regulator